MLDKSCMEFIDALASKAPVPGGGGASALVGAVGVALGSMVGNLTTGKKKYADVEEEIQALLKASDDLTKKLSGLVQADADVFEPLSRAYGLPSETEEEKAEKEKILQEVLIQATLVPLQIAESCLEGLRLLDEYAKKGSRLVVSDAGVGAIFCKSALQGAKLNVLINLKLMKDEAQKQEFRERMAAVEAEGLKLADQIYEYVEEQLCC
jgi:formiminotetrahydrofolate cyclodeaminase